VLSDAAGMMLRGSRSGDLDGETLLVVEAPMGEGKRSSRAGHEKGRMRRASSIFRRAILT
jgi:hypothetical protein